MGKPILQLDNILVNLPCMKKNQAIKTAADLLVKQGYVTDYYYDLMLKRERECETYIGNGIAIPHGVKGSETQIKNSGIVVLQFKDGIDYDGNKAYLVIGIAGRDNEHIEILSKIACIIQYKENVNKIVRCNTKKEVYDLLVDVN